MGKKVVSRSALAVTANVNILSSHISLPRVDLKIIVTVVPQLAGYFSVVRIDGTTERIAKMFAGSLLVVGFNNKDYKSSPKFYSDQPDEIRYNFRYSVSTTFDIFTAYVEREHAEVFDAA